MSEQVGAIHYDLDIDNSRFNKKLNDASTKMQGLSKKFESIGQSMTNVGKKMTIGVTLPIVAGMTYAVKSASDLEESINAVNVVFGEGAKQVLEFSKTSSKAVGLASSDFNQLASVTGALLKDVGLPMAEVGDLTNNLAVRAADMASVMNTDVTDAMNAINAALRGETEAIRRYTGDVTDATLEQFRLANGIKKPVKEMNEQEKRLLRLKVIMSQTDKFAGDFANTQDSLANKMRILKAQFKDASVQIGEILLPYVQKVVSYFKDLIERFKALSPAQQKMIILVAGILAVMGPLLIVIGTLISSIGSLIPLLASPIFWIFLAVATAIAGIAYLVWKNWDSIKPVIDRVIEVFRVAYDWFSQNILPILKTVAGFVAKQFVSAWHDLIRAFNQVKQAIEPYKPQLILLGKILLGVGLVIAGALIGSIVAFIAVLVAVITVIARVIGWIARIIGWFIRMGNSVSQAMNNARRAIFGVFSGAWNWLYNAGRNIINGLANGIRSLIYKPVEIVKSGLSRIRNLLPFSPAKEGPFSGKGYTEYSGKALMQGLATGIEKASNVPQMALNKAISGIQSDISLNTQTPATGGINKRTMNHYGDIVINDRQDAQAIMQILGRQQELSNYGLAR